jgi:hypothetical protein
VAGRGRDRRNASPKPSTSSAASPGPSQGKENGKGKTRLLRKCGILDDLDITYVDSELELLASFTQLVNK